MSDSIKSNDSTAKGHNPISDAVDAIAHKILEELNKHGMSAPDNVNKGSAEATKKELPKQANQFLPVLEIHHGNH